MRVGRIGGSLMFGLILSVALLTGCSHGGDGVESAPPQWHAFDFDQVVMPLHSRHGILDSFEMSITSSISENGSLNATRFDISGSYLGVETVEVATVRGQLGNTGLEEYDETLVYPNVECQKVGHRLTVGDEGGGSYPDWADIMVWTPTDKTMLLDSEFGLCAKFTYVDSNGDRASWSYFLTDTMKSELGLHEVDRLVTYAPYVEGDLSGLQVKALMGLYNETWHIFRDFACGGYMYLMQSGIEFGSGMSYICLPVTRSVGFLDFDAYEIHISTSRDSAKADFFASLVQDFPLPLLLRFSFTVNGSESSLDFVLTDVELRSP